MEGHPSLQSVLREEVGHYRLLLDPGAWHIFHGLVWLPVWLPQLWCQQKREGEEEGELGERGESTEVRFWAMSPTQSHHA